MKKIMIIALFFIVSFVYSSEAVIEAYSPTGWTSSSGLSFMIGLATNVRPTGNGYTFNCSGIDGTCYFINGNILTIYNSIKEPQEFDPEIVIQPR